MGGVGLDRFPSPLRYPGGKGKVANYLKLLLIENGLSGVDYVELYAGGASVGLSLLFEEYADIVHINDINRSVYAFWNAVLSDTSALTKRIWDTPVTVEEWNRQRAIQSAQEPDEIDLAFSTFFLNRTSRSGIIGGGIIGGRDQSGTWKLDARFNRSDLVRRVEKIARFANRIELTRLDAAEYLRTRLTSLRKPFLYLDPPYYIKGKGLYESFYEHNDHLDIAKLVSALTGVPWVVSYDAVPPIMSMYSAYRALEYTLSYSAGDRYRGDEVMFFARSIRLPEPGSPANVPGSQVLASLSVR